VQLPVIFMSNQYKKEIRNKRNEILSEWLNNCGFSEASFINQFGKKELKIFKDKFKPSLIRSQNRIRGLVGEFLGYEYANTHFDTSQNSIIKDKKTFQTPFGNRRIDVYIDNKKVCIEVKMGYLYNGKKIRNQIEKDSYLLKNKIVSKIVWILYQNGSKQVKKNIKKNNFDLIVGGYSGSEVIFEKDTNFILPNLQVSSAITKTTNVNPIDDGNLVYVIYHLNDFFTSNQIPDKLVNTWKENVMPNWMEDNNEMKIRLLKWLRINKEYLINKIDFNLLEKKLLNI